MFPDIVYFLGPNFQTCSNPPRATWRYPFLYQPARQGPTGGHADHLLFDIKMFLSHTWSYSVLGSNATFSSHSHSLFVFGLNDSFVLPSLFRQYLVSRLRELNTSCSLMHLNLASDKKLIFLYPYCPAEDESVH